MMLLNLNEIGQQQIESDVCIIGAGAAGITMALKLEALGIKTTLLEGGGLTYPKPGTHDLYDAEIGNKFYPVQASRLRYLGGSTNHWGGWSRKLDHFDFMDKPYFDGAGWPIDRNEVNKYYSEAANICEIPNLDAAHNGYYKKQLTDGVINWKNTDFTNKFFVFSPPTRFGSKYLEDLKSAKHVNTILHANATNLLFLNNRVTGVKAQSLNGNSLTVKAKLTVCAMGGLENPRFLLNQKNETFKNGVGNHSDNLGRYFMDHPGFQPIDLLLPTELKYKLHQFESQKVMPVLSMSKEALLNHKLNNFCVLLNRTKDSEFLPGEYGKNPWFQTPGKMGNYRSQFIFEPSPCKESRVTLTNEKDQLGMLKLKLDWQFNKRDFDSVERIIGLLTTALGSRHLGRVNWHKQFNSETIAAIGGGMHHAGTTIMANNSDDGVVDQNCKVHQCEGLYVTGNSVFSNVGFSNPTLTIVALSLRLCEHIQKELQ
ncbi:GMC oxidoreductase [Marinicella rhabdoformis]|uniref:GMC oxidoreductase n=1 Tax=Marinicella rhabdoformis TaxID=2580566 RepID=UPI0012AEC4D2|nr:GMC family oxidoreductase [Marinicella rhabdoformis]